VYVYVYVYVRVYVYVCMCICVCGLGFGSDADNFEFENINVRVCVATLVVLWVRDGFTRWSSTHASVVGEISAWDRGRRGCSGQPEGFEEVFVGSQLDTTGGIFVRACMQWGTAFDYAKNRGHEDTAVRDTGEGQGEEAPGDCLALADRKYAINRDYNARAGDDCSRTATPGACFAATLVRSIFIGQHPPSSICMCPFDRVLHPY